jgi:hypothetical protein
MFFIYKQPATITAHYQFRRVMHLKLQLDPGVLLSEITPQICHVQLRLYSLLYPEALSITSLYYLQQVKNSPATQRLASNQQF